MPHYIKDLLTAGVVYYQSRNIASLQLEDFIKVLRTVRSLGTASVTDVDRVLGGGVYHRDISGYLSLGWHTGLLGYYEKGFYVLTHIGERFLKSCESPSSGTCIEELGRVFSTWTPYILFSEFVRARGFSRDGVIRDLGKEMLYWTEIMLRAGLPVGAEGKPRSRPVRKPFNSFVVARFFKPLLDTIGPVTGKHRKQVYWSRRGEPIAASGVASTIVDSDGGEAAMVTYVVDYSGLDLVLRSVKAAPRKPGRLVIVAHKLDFDINRARTAISEIKTPTPLK